DAGNGYTKTLLCFLQLFIISNRTNTYYFANNNTRHFTFNADERFLPIYQYADKNNKKINHLDEFTETFLSKCTLGEAISRYMVLVASEQKLLMMRPYQIYAVKAIVQRIKENNGNGYIWHTTGSGKTLTSFKTATLLKENPDIEKCLFVVDRKDLDRQTREEFNRFQEKCVEENTNTDTLVRRLLSDDYADKVIVTTIQKLGLALDENSLRNKKRSKDGLSTYKEQLAPLQNKRIVFIFDECHRSQFGDNHKAIKSFFPKAQLFGFTGTPIFEENASRVQVTNEEASLRTTNDLFEDVLHRYTITHAIEDKNVLRFHIDYFKTESEKGASAGVLTKKAIIEAILDKHDAATVNRRFNAILATASIPDAIEYFDLFKEVQVTKQAAEPEFVPLNIACVFSPPVDSVNAEAKNDIKQIQDDLPQEKEDNKINPEGKKQALLAILADYNARYKTNHTLGEFDTYYQDIQKRIKDHQWPNSDLPASEKIDITIVVDMLLTGFDSKYLKALYVDKNLKHHGLIQAFSRTNRILNSTKTYGNILDFRSQQAAVDEAIALFSGEENKDQVREIWLVDQPAVVMAKLAEAVRDFKDFMHGQNLAYAPESAANLLGDEARLAFVQHFKEVQRLKVQLDQYTDKTAEQIAEIETLMPQDVQRGFKGAYLEIAQRLKSQREADQHEGGKIIHDVPTLEMPDFEFVLFDSTIVDYDYIIKLMARFSHGDTQTMPREELIALIKADAKFTGQEDDLTAYINTLKAGEGLNIDAIKSGYEAFKHAQTQRQIADLAAKHGLPVEGLQHLVDFTLQRMIFDGDTLTDLMSVLGLGWIERAAAETALMDDLIPLLKKCAGERDISGLRVYEI
ncbi:MAG: HsdR family type I site-specific deoxyribonuclease, partial [Neisseriaceae bacterium]|nr:HsdR family type I site-specific deoxyribonuclease [Neisseriaceae bacterium]